MRDHKKYPVNLHFKVLKWKCLCLHIHYQTYNPEDSTMFWKKKTSFRYFINKYNTKRSLSHQRRKCSWKIKALDWQGSSKLNIYWDILYMSCLICLPLSKVGRLPHTRKSSSQSDHWPVKSLFPDFQFQKSEACKVLRIIDRELYRDKNSSRHQIS